MRIFFAALLLAMFFVSPALAADTAPVGQTESADSLFDTQRGYFHPTLSLAEVYTDNLFNTRNNEEEFTTIISPGIWLAFPGQLQPAEPIITDTTAAGGLSVSRFGEKDERPFNAYLNYQADIKRHKNHSSEDITNHKVHGLARIAFASGLSFEANDVFTHSHDAYATGTSTGQNEFDSNLLGVNAQIPFGERFSSRLEYSRFDVDYDTAANSFRDRSDDTYSLYLFYNYSPKTRFFAQYSFLDISYDSSSANDNEQQRYYLGIDYDWSEKLQFLVKLGYSDKDRDAGTGDREEFVYQLEADYQLTPKNNLNLLLWRQLKESDTPGTNGVIGQAFNISFSQMFGDRVVGSALAGWSRDEYNGAITVGTVTAEREDDYYTITLAVSYSMLKWFEISGGYSYIKRDSNFNSFDYDSNEVFLKLTGHY